jgi:hypothetical protein
MALRVQVGWLVLAGDECNLWCGLLKVQVRWETEGSEWKMSDSCR